MNYYESRPQVDYAERRVDAGVSPDDRVRATVGSRSFTGTVIGGGYDGEPVVYVRDTVGHERAVRPQRDRYDIQPAGEGTA